ncbi:MAG: hypothetical protein E6R03_05670 [Hyphomicrobiaceae bacterium]|nr:MAG: hypothetical protein E6R03_05670 [Hyphomicrobiaceae bacterium]
MALADWLEITEAHIRTRFSSTELTAFRQAAQIPGDEDAVAGIIDVVTAYVRGNVAACSRNQLAETGIPSTLLDAALDLITVRIMQRAHGAIVDVDGERKKSSERAEALMRQVRECNGPWIPVPDDPVTITRPVLDITYDTNDRVQVFGYPNQDGL